MKLLIISLLFIASLIYSCEDNFHPILSYDKTILGKWDCTENLKTLNSSTDEYIEKDTNYFLYITDTALVCSNTGVTYLLNVTNDSRPKEKGPYPPDTKYRSWRFDSNYDLGNLYYFKYDNIQIHFEVTIKLINADSLEMVLSTKTADYQTNLEERIIKGKRIESFKSIKQ